MASKKNQGGRQAAPAQPQNATTKASDEDAALEDASQGGGGSPRANFQSDEAQDAAIKAAQPNVDEGGPTSAEVGNDPTEDEDGKKIARPVQPQVDQNKMVKVRPLRTEKRVRIADKWYSFVQGKECLVPRHVATLLRQKGLLA